MMVYDVIEHVWLWHTQPSGGRKKVTGKKVTEKSHGKKVTGNKVTGKKSQL